MHLITNALAPCVQFRSFFGISFRLYLLLTFFFQTSILFAQSPAIDANASIQWFRVEDFTTHIIQFHGNLGNLIDSGYKKPDQNTPYTNTDWAIVKTTGPIIPGSGPLNHLPSEAFHPSAISMSSNNAEFTFWFSPESHNLKKEDEIQGYVKLARVSDNKEVWVPLAPKPPATRLKIESLPTSFVAPLWQPQLGFQAERLNGSKAPLAFRNPLKAEFVDVLTGEVTKGRVNGRLTVSTDSLLSLPTDDKLGHVNLTAAYRKTHFTGNVALDFVRTTARLEARSNMAATDQSATFAVDMSMPVSFLTPNIGSFIKSPTRPNLTLTPIVYQDWWRKDIRAVPNHTRDGLVYSRAFLGFEPLYLFSKKTPGRTEAITFGADMTSYFFWNEKRIAGASQPSWLGATQVNVTIPLKGKFPNIPSISLGNTRPVIRLTYGRQINEAANFATSPNVAVTLDFLPIGDRR